MAGARSVHFSEVTPLEGHPRTSKQIDAHNNRKNGNDILGIEGSSRGNHTKKKSEADADAHLMPVPMANTRKRPFPGQKRRPRSFTIFGVFFASPSCGFQRADAATSHAQEESVVKALFCRRRVEKKTGTFSKF